MPKSEGFVSYTNALKHAQDSMSVVLDPRTNHEVRSDHTRTIAKFLLLLGDALEEERINRWHQTRDHALHGRTLDHAIEIADLAHGELKAI